MLFMKLIFLSVFMFIMSMMVFSFNRKHLLIILLMLEFMVLSLFILFMINLMMMGSEIYFLMLFLVFSVCEGALGLSILVHMIRMYGSDYFQVFNLLKC
uniref:NADH-ubiquinone oxidoreductase chain 4L n=1 Tax=Rhyacophila kando TaxID=2904902 RepID=A0A9E8LPB3_9NEOP|nr:NADH dehydrogenase subunit 4L [Rhyacophila kando]UZZ44360.1 NADH dehydrogenase subunit 4L [Rhyacophila kando]